MAKYRTWYAADKKYACVIFGKQKNCIGKVY